MLNLVLKVIVYTVYAASKKLFNIILMAVNGEMCFLEPDGRYSVTVSTNRANWIMLTSQISTLWYSNISLHHLLHFRFYVNIS